MVSIASGSVHAAASAEKYSESMETGATVPCDKKASSRSACTPTGGYAPEGGPHGRMYIAPDGGD